MRQSFTDFTKRQEGDGKCANPFDRITDNTVTVTGTDAGEREDSMTENLKDFAGVTLLADIGNGTMNLMYLNNGRPMESKAWTEKLGVFQCFQKIHNMVQDKTGDNLMDDVIDNILRSGKIELPEPHVSIVEKAICDYVEEIYQKLRDHEYNEKLMKTYFMGGGARLVEQFGNYNTDATIFNQDIRANAKWYEYYCYMILRHQSKSGRR